MPKDRVQDYLDDATEYNIKQVKKAANLKGLGVDYKSSGQERAEKRKQRDWRY